MFPRPCAAREAVQVRRRAGTVCVFDPHLSRWPSSPDHTCRQPTDLRHPPPQRRQAAGFSLAEMMVVLAIIMLLVVLTIPNMLLGVRKAEEAKAVETLRSIQSAQEAHRILHGSYATSFRALSHKGTPVAGPEAKTASGLGGQEIMVFHGYIFRLQLLSGRTYQVTAEPVHWRNRLNWYTMDEFGEIRTPEGLAEPTAVAPKD